MIDDLLAGQCDAVVSSLMQGLNDVTLDRGDVNQALTENDLFDGVMETIEDSKKVDPDPIGPIFDKSNGVFIGSSLEGSSNGKLYFMDPKLLTELDKKFGVFSPSLGVKVVTSLILKKYGKGTYIKIPTNQVNLEIQAKAINWVIERTNLVNLNVPTDALSKLPNNKPSYYTFFGYNENPAVIGVNSPSPPYTDGISNPAWTNDFYPNAGKVNYNIGGIYHTTVADLQSIWIHEFVGHFIRGWNDANKSHHRAYELQMSHSTWNYITPDLKALIVKNYEEYLEKEK